MQKLIYSFILLSSIVQCFASTITSKDLALALDTTNIVWDAGGDSLWFFQGETTYDGTDALQSGNIEDNESSWVQCSTTNSGILTYRVKVSSAADSDFLRFYLNDVELTNHAASGDVDWIEKTVILPPVTNTLRWVYIKDAISISGNDCIWLDQVEIEPIPLIYISAVPTNSTWDIGGSVSGSGYYEYNSIVSIEAIPFPHYTVSWWFFDGVRVVGATTNPYVFSAISNRVIAVEFKPDLLSVSLSSNPTNGGTVARSGYQRYNTAETNTATAASDYAFSHWSDGGTNVSTSAIYVYTLVSDRTLVANFTRSYTVSTSSSPPSSGVASGGGNYPEGTSCTVTATPNAGYSFSRWTHDGTNVSTSANYTFTVDGDIALVADFSLNSYAVTTSSSPADGGSTSGGGTYFYGDSCTIGASVNPGYTFVNWTLNGSPISYSVNYAFTVSGSKSFLASFTYDFPLADAVDSINPTTFTTSGSLGTPASGSVAWTRQTTYSHDGVDSAKSGDINDGGFTRISTVVSGAGTISFWWWLDTSDAADTFIFYVDGVQKAQNLPDIVSDLWVVGPWRYTSVSITGTESHTLTWKYTKDDIGSQNSDSGYLDQVIWTAE